MKGSGPLKSHPLRVTRVPFRVKGKSYRADETRKIREALTFENGYVERSNARFDAASLQAARERKNRLARERRAAAKVADNAGGIEP